MITKEHQYTSTPIYNYLKDALLSGQFIPGEQITETKIANLFGSSRTPVRDAFRKLAEDGLLVVNPNKSVVVASYDDNTIGQLGVVRLQLDILSAKLALHYGSNSDFLKMRDIANRCYEAEMKGDHSEAIALDADFHIALAKTSHNDFLYNFQSAIWLLTRYMLINEKKGLLNYSERIKVHFDIVDAIIARDEETTLTKIKEHLLARYSMAEDLPPNFIENL